MPEPARSQSAGAEPAPAGPELAPPGPELALPAPGLTIGQAAKRTGLSVHALRFWEREGLLASPVSRRPGGQRVYSEDDLEWLELCVKLRSTGMPLAMIRAYTELVRQGPGNERERLTILREHHDRLTTQIATQTACLEIIEFKIGLYEGSLSAGTADPVWVPSSP
jgi:DNA-binding transcriptional MerR regulator